MRVSLIVGIVLAGMSASCWTCAAEAKDDHKAPAFYKKLIERDTASLKAIPAHGSIYQIALGDVTGDGRNEIITADYEGRIRAMDKVSHRTLWTYDSGAFIYDLKPYDIDGDGKAEILAAAADGMLYCLSSTGKPLWKYGMAGQMYQVVALKTSRGILIACGGEEKRIVILDAKGAKIREIPLSRPAHNLTSGDLTGDGYDELIYVSEIGEATAWRMPEFRKLWNTTLKKSSSTDWSRGGNYWRPIGAKTCDLDNDGKAEVYFEAGWPNGNAIQMLGSDGKRLWYAGSSRDRFGDWMKSKRDFINSSQASAIIPINADGDKLIIVKFPRHIKLLTSSGKVIAEATSEAVTYNNVAAEKDGDKLTVYLASSPDGDDQIYQLELGKDWEKTFAANKITGQMLRIRKNLEKLREQVMAYKGAPPADKKYLYFIGSSHVSKVNNGVRVSTYRKQFPYRNLDFALYVNAAENTVFPDWRLPLNELTEGYNKYVADWHAKNTARLMRQAAKTVVRGDGITVGGLPKDKIPELLKKHYEAEKAPFVAIIGHGMTPYFTVETAENILKACPEYCRGFQTCESHAGYPRNEVFGYLMDRVGYPVMDLCKQYGNRKFYFVEKNSFWLTIPAIKQFEKMFDGPYRDTLVPSVEDSNSRCPELNLAGRAGLFRSGAVNDWSSRFVSDEMRFGNVWSDKWIFYSTGHPFLRRGMAGVLLGARTIEPIAPRGINTVSGCVKFHQAAMECQYLLLHMLGKGLLVAPKKDEILNVSPCVFSMTEPDKEFQRESRNIIMSYTPGKENRNSPFEGLARWWGMAPCRDSYVGKYLMDIDRHFGGGIPSTPYGLPVFVPDYLVKNQDWIKDTVVSDGATITVNGKKLNGLQARPYVLEKFKQAAQLLPYRAEGKVFMAAQKMGPNRDRLTIMDSGFRDPEDREVTLHFQKKQLPKKVKDILSGETLTVKSRQIKLKVPAACFRILEATY